MHLSLIQPQQTLSLKPRIMCRGRKTKMMGVCGVEGNISKLRSVEWHCDRRCVQTGGAGWWVLLPIFSHLWEVGPCLF